MKRFYSLFQPDFSAHVVVVQAVLACFKVLSFFFFFLVSPSVFAFNSVNLHGNGLKAELMFPNQVTNQGLCFDQGDISGVIVNQQSGKPISGVPVVLSSIEEIDVPKLITVTGPDGRYFFEGLVFGKYLIQVQDANLNVVRGLFASGASEVQVNLDECAVDVSEFVYGSNDPLFLSGRVWYDANGNGVQDEWFDANDDGRVTQNDFSNGAVEINKWEWFDLNGDGRYDGPENYGELNIAGFGNTQSSNIKVKSAEGPSYEAMIDHTGYWSRTFDHSIAFGNYSASLEMDGFLNEAAKNIGETGLIKTLPNLRIEDFNNIRMDIQCGLTTSDLLERELSRSVGHHSDLLFGVRCREELVEIIANDDEIGEHFSSTLEPLGNILENDVIKGNPVDPEKVEVELIELDGLIGLNINEKGELILLIPGINSPGTYQLEYVLRENGFPDTFDKATVTVTLLADNVDLAIEKTSNDVEIFEGDEFEYTITVTNLGETNASNVEIIDFFNSGLTYIKTSFIATDKSVELDTKVEGNKIVYTVPELPAGAILTLTVLVQADAISGQNPLRISNQATVSSAEEDLDMSNNTAADFNVVKPFFIPNVITPNGDNKNDAFEIRGISKFTANNILIYNRYGDHVYERANYDNNWDAPNQVAGTYYYIFQGEDAGGKTHEFKGWVQVIKD